MRDTIIVKVDGKKEFISKRLLLLSVGEAYDQFCRENETLKISKSKFYQIRPREIVLPESNGIHKV